MFFKPKKKYHVAQIEKDYYLGAYVWRRSVTALCGGWPAATS